MAKRPAKVHDLSAALDDYCRREGKTYEELFYTGDEAAERFAVAGKLLFRRLSDPAPTLTSKEEAIRKDILANIDRTNPDPDEITPAMMAAGLEALSLFSTTDDPGEWIVESVYRAMDSVRSDRPRAEPDAFETPP